MHICSFINEEVQKHLANNFFEFVNHIKNLYNFNDRVMV